jgi:hypothetical protein
MKTKVIEASQSLKHGPNWGKFLVGRLELDVEFKRESVVDPGRPLLAGQCHREPGDLLVLDLQTGEGAMFRPRAFQPSDLAKHRIWVCPLYEPFLVWLMAQDLRDLTALPDFVELSGAEEALYGHHRGG